ncbi:MAG: acyl-CoA/acyl-ACP dehydrogenase [Candidatus Binatia bacterium]|nr:acyl-CoA/acyl-ACP dehydrogenase [Candidatus Binatia bacterium]
MNFGLSPEQELLQKTARDFLAVEWPPSAARAVLADDHDGYPRQLYEAMARLGWVGVLAPTEFGGLGGTCLDAAVLAEELGRAAVPGPHLANTLAILTLRHAPGATMRRDWLPRLAAGQAVGSLAWFEGDASAWPFPLQTRGTVGRFGIRLQGVKRFVLDAHVADVLLVVCTLVDAGTRSTGIVLVPREQAGLSVRFMEDVDRTHRPCEVAFEGVTVSRRWLLAAGPQAEKLLARVQNAAAVLLAADCLGGAERLLEMSVEYAKVRQQFGRPIGSFQAVKHRCAEMAAEIELARSLVWYAAYAMDALPRQAAYAASLAKGHLSEVFCRVAESALRVHGGIGFTWEHPLHIWFKRAQWNRYAFGSPEWHRERVAQESGW